MVAHPPGGTRWPENRSAPVDQRIQVSAFGERRMHRRVRISRDVDSFELFDRREATREICRVWDPGSVPSCNDRAIGRPPSP